MKRASYNLSLPFPPSTNTFYTVFRNRKILSAKGKKYKTEVARLLKKQVGLHPQKLTGRLRVYLGFSRGDKRSYDIANYEKCVMDCFTDVLYTDDSQIDKIIMERLPVSPPLGSCEVFIEQIPKDEQVREKRKEKSHGKIKTNTDTDIYQRLKHSGRKR